MENCIFCKIINKEIPSKVIYENEFTIAFLDVFPNSDGHCLVIPKKHFENFELTDDQYAFEVLKTKKEVIKILRNKLPVEPTGFNYISNQGEQAFQTVFHYHEHIIPKYVKEEGYTFVIKKDEAKMTDLEKLHQLFK
ncbi:HIT family protein [Spiroplasma culicicola]|uniref:Histidine triad protein n=1 Tax=Spiroplasma culicicola AES-1 TaxID=1276246 RepID=W6A7N5_9MOLU|nr:HIT family protein [Spiroplasma culicicola]AHI53153.1 histidine triad protein [Spiroplasma culicicola AES-1]